MKSLNLRLAFLFAAALVLSAALAPNANAKSVQVWKGKPAKYVFFFIGDGMALPQRSSAEMFSGQPLAINQMPVQGLTTTYAADRFITGSAAAATALSSGQKTNIGMIAQAPDGKSVKTVAEMARDNGQKVGIVSSVSIDHATPAAFYAHVPSRSMYYDIDHAIAESGFDFFAGGGLKDPANKKEKKAMHEGNALDAIKKAGYKVVTDKESFMALKPSDGKVIAWNENLPDGKALPYVIDMTSKDVTLPEYTKKAIEMLDNDKGFFLMVEGGKIDWACHANDAVSSMGNTVAFDDSVKVAMDFYKKHPKETLIIVTGDHETGGLTIGFAGTQYESYTDLLSAQNISFQKFTDDVLPLWISECHGGCEFENLEPTITHYFGLKFEGDAKADSLVLEPFEVAMLKEAFIRTVAGDKIKANDTQTNLLYGGYDPLTMTITHILNNKAGFGWTSYKHPGVTVATSGMGVGSEVFGGYYDNTDVALKVMSVMGVRPKVYTADNSKLNLASN